MSEHRVVLIAWPSKGGPSGYCVEQFRAALVRNVAEGKGLGGTIPAPWEVLRPPEKALTGDVPRIGEHLLIVERPEGKTRVRMLKVFDVIWCGLFVNVLVEIMLTHEVPA